MKQIEMCLSSKTTKHKILSSSFLELVCAKDRQIHSSQEKKLNQVVPTSPPKSFQTICHHFCRPLPSTCCFSRCKVAQHVVPRALFVLNTVRAESKLPLSE